MTARLPLQQYQHNHLSLAHTTPTRINTTITIADQAQIQLGRRAGLRRGMAVTRQERDTVRSEDTRHGDIPEQALQRTAIRGRKLESNGEKSSATCAWVGHGWTPLLLGVIQAEDRKVARALSVGIKGDILAAPNRHT